MVNRTLISAKLAELADRVARVRTCRTSTETELKGDRNAAELVAFNLMLAVQICADIASHLIAGPMGRRAPPLYHLRNPKPM